MNVAALKNLMQIGIDDEAKIQIPLKPLSTSFKIGKKSVNSCMKNSRCTSEKKFIYISQNDYRNAVNVFYEHSIIKA